MALLYITLLALISTTGRLASAQSNHIVDRPKKDSGTFVPLTFESFRIISVTPSELKERRIKKKRSPVDVPPHIVRRQKPFCQKIFLRFSR